MQTALKRSAQVVCCDEGDKRNNDLQCGLHAA
jgi:hypothetical protein